VRIVHSGTVSSMRVRGTMPPSYNVIEIDGDSVKINLREPGKDADQPLASFSRTPSPPASSTRTSSASSSTTGCRS
jgi:hypothetical protein